MTYEKSCGAVVFTVVQGEVKYLLIRSKTGAYGFPKGHVEGDETEVETALREVFEETNLKIDLIDGFRETTEYPLPRKANTVKLVVFFLGSFKDQEIKYQREELSGACLASYPDAVKLLRYENTKRILKAADGFINKKI